MTMKKLNFALLMLIFLFASNSAMANTRIIVNGRSQNSTIARINSTTRIRSFTSPNTNIGYNNTYLIDLLMM
jgi:hypothetical protein